MRYLTVNNKRLCELLGMEQTGPDTIEFKLPIGLKKVKRGSSWELTIEINRERFLLDNPMSNPEHRATHKERVRAMQTKSLRKNRSDRMKGKNPMRLEEQRKRQSELMKKRYQDPAFRAKMTRNFHR